MEMDSDTLGSGDVSGTMETSADVGSAGDYIPAATDGVESGVSADHGGQSAPAGSGEVTYNPAWKDILSVVPEQFHSVVTPKLKEWDRSYGQLASNYAPYKKYVEQGLDETSLERAVSLLNLVSNNPQEVYRRLGDALGMSPQQAQAVAEQVEEEQQEDTQSLYDVQDPRYDQLQQQYQALQHQTQQMHQQMLQQQYSAQIDSDIKKLMSQHGNFDVPDVMNRYMAQIQRGEQPSVAKAYAEQQAFIKSYMESQQKATRQTPKVMSPSGGIPSGQEQISLKTQEDRVNAIQTMLRAASQE